MFVIHQEVFMFKLISHSLYAVFIAVALGVLAAPGTVGLSQPAQDPKKQSKAGPRSGHGHSGLGYSGLGSASSHEVT